MASDSRPEFTGEALPFSDAAIGEAAESLGCDEAALRAVMEVESRGGFLKDRRPKILFERHYFSRLTNRRFDGDPSGVSAQKAGGYRGGAGEYDRLAAAMRLDRAAALKSASWGAFQIMGANHRMAGYDDVQAFCDDMCRSEDKQLLAFVRFVKASRLDDKLRRHDWAGFARGYNGPAYRKNRYDEKLAAAYRRHLRGPDRPAGAAPPSPPLSPSPPVSPSSPSAPQPRLLRMGDRGDEVKALQRALGVRPDGIFGRDTRSAVEARQRACGLKADGIVGPRTRAALGL